MVFHGSRDAVSWVSPRTIGETMPDKSYLFWGAYWTLVVFLTVTVDPNVFLIGLVCRLAVKYLGYGNP